MGKAKQMKKQIKIDEYDNDLLPSKGNEIFNCHNMSKKIQVFVKSVSRTVAQAINHITKI